MAQRLKERKYPMAPKPRILVLSSANMDLMLRMKAIPQAGETRKEEQYAFVPGGKGANAALAVARLGGDCVFCTRLGNDLNGKILREYYRDNHIDTRFVTADPQAKTGLAAVMVEQSGQNRIVVYPGANECITAEDADDALTCLPDALFMQLEIARDVVLFAAEKARAKCIPVILDAGPASKDFPLEKLGQVEIFSPNETETEIFCGIRPDTMQNCMKACMALQKRIKAKYYVLKLGERGAYIYDGKFYQFVAAYDVKAVDTTGCGDAFSAAMTLEYLRSHDISRAVEYANIVGALTVMRAGAGSSIPSARRVREFVEKNNLAFNLDPEAESEQA